MASSISPSVFEQTGAMFTQPNVRSNNKFDTTEQSKRKVNKHLHDTLFPLVLAKPNWIFTVSSHSHYSGTVVALGFIISEGGEKLGEVAIEYQGSGYKIIVHNERINAKRERGSGYKTEKSDKAMLAIRKHFYRLGTGERIEKVREEAATVIEHAKHNHDWDVNRAQVDMMQDAHDFAVAHMEQYLAEFPQRGADRVKYDEAQEVAMIVDNVKDLFDKNEALVVVLDGEHYIVVQGTSEPQKYTSDTLPYHMREKIGLLKLVEDRQMIKDVGCRVKADAFVITPEAKEQA